MQEALTVNAWSNDVNKSWWRDAGLRRMATHIIVLYLCVFTFGYDGSLLNGLQTIPSWQTSFHHPVGSELGLIAAAFYLPKVVSPIVASFVADRYGRRLSLLIGSAVSIPGIFVCTFAHTTNMLIGGRVLLGWGLGMQATIAPPMVQELCHPRLRAVAGGMYLAMFYVGSTFSAWICFGTLHWTSAWAWRVPMLFQIIGTGVVGIYLALGLMPESPRWLVSKGKVDQATVVIAKMHANNDTEDALVVSQMAEMEESHRIAAQDTGNLYLAFLKTPGNRKRLFVLVVTAAATQLNGVGLVSYYLAPILRLVGITKPAQQAGINGGLAIFNLITTLTFAQFVERIGRRPLWLVGSTGTLLMFAVVTGLSGTFAETKNRQAGIAVVPFLYIWYLFYNMAWATLANLYIAEILPTKLRSKGMSIYVMTQSVSLAFNQYVNPVALAAIAWKYYFVYLGVQLLLIVFAYFFYVETKGRTIEEVSMLFDGDAAADNIAATAEQKVQAATAEQKVQGFGERKKNQVYIEREL